MFEWENVLRGERVHEDFVPFYQNKFCEMAVLNLQYFVRVSLFSQCVINSFIT